MYFQYDTNGTPLGFIYNGAQYFYVTNQMGDVIVIIAADGDVVCQYLYDEWGKGLGAFVSDEENAEYVTVANANPLRYRGYYYDNETGYYYLQSRYYDPSICRFINADIPEMARISKDISVGTNLFAYCNNDAINNTDLFGFLSADGVARMVNWSSILSMFLPMLYASYRKALLSISLYITKITTPISFKAFWWKPAVAVAIVVAAVAIVIATIAIAYAKIAKKTAKERAKDCPSWLAGAMGALPPHINEKAKDYAKRLFDSRYGKGKWNKGAGSEYSKTVKYLQRHLGMK